MLAYSIALLLAGTVLGVTTIACSTAYSHQVDKSTLNLLNFNGVPLALGAACNSPV
jgi:hypothetical protein